MVSRLLTVALLAGSVGCAYPADQGTVLVSAAISLSDALSVVVTRYEAATGRPVALNLAGSDTLATQIIAGAPVDLFISADQTQMDRVAATQRIEPGSRVDLLANQLVVVIPETATTTLASLDDLRAPAIRRIAVGDPDAVPAGVYTRRYFESVGLWSSIQHKVAPTRDVRAALAAVAAGHADAGVVYRTDLTGTRVQRALEIPVAQGPDVRYPAAVLRPAPNPGAAQEFFTFLQSQEAKAIFERAGFVWLGS